MALDGLQDILAERYRERGNKNNYYNPKVNLVRYADDFIITCENRDLLETEIKPLVQEFLAVRGLTLSEEKTRITHIDEGFDFLEFNVRKYDGVLLIKPSKKSIKSFYDKIKVTVDGNKSAKQESLIRLLNPIINGWTNYYRNCIASETFNKLDHMIVRKLWRWAYRRHPKKGERWVKHRYFHVKNGRDWIFGVEKESKEGLFSLMRLSEKKIIRYVKIRNDANPYDTEWESYFKYCETRKMLEHFDGRKTVERMWEKQMRRCPVCGKSITEDSQWIITNTIINGKRVKYLTHGICCRITDTNKWSLL